MGKYFTISELSASDTAKSKGINNTPGENETKALELLIKNVLDPVREKFGKPIKVNSGYRCPELNKLVKGAATSHHVRGMAADITCSDNKALWELMNEMIKSKEIKTTQLINEYGLKWIHVSYQADDLKNQVFTIK